MPSDVIDARDKLSDSKETDSPVDTKRRLSKHGQQAVQGQISDKSRLQEWKDVGIVTVKTDDLPDPDGIKSAEDFQKVSMSEMQEGLIKLEAMKPYIESGEGNSSYFWRKLDQQNEVEYKDGYQRIYEAFYGTNAIKVNQDGNYYDIVNGRHRIWLAKQMGIKELPVHLIVRE